MAPLISLFQRHLPIVKKRHARGQLKGGHSSYPQFQYDPTTMHPFSNQCRRWAEGGAAPIQNATKVNQSASTTSENLNSISGCTAGRGMGRLSDGVAPRRRRPLDAGRCCGLRGCNVRPPSVRSRLAFKMSHKLLFLCAWGQVPPSMILSGRAGALRACGATIHPYT